MPPIIPYDACTTKKDFVMVVWRRAWLSSVSGICRMYGSESNLDNMYLLAWWTLIQSFPFCIVGVKNKVISYSNALKVKNVELRRFQSVIVDSFTFEEIIVDL